MTVRARPCPSCPYRQDVPSGIWEASEYAKLPGFDGEIADQAVAGATAMFACHQRTGELCAGWAGCHGMRSLLAARLHAAELDEADWDYQSPVPLFGSGAQAAAHGMRDVENPGEEARIKMESLIRLREARKKEEGSDARN